MSEPFALAVMFLLVYESPVDRYSTEGSDLLIVADSESGLDRVLNDLAATKRPALVRGNPFVSTAEPDVVIVHEADASQDRPLLAAALAHFGDRAPIVVAVDPPLPWANRIDLARRGAEDVHISGHPTALRELAAWLTDRWSTPYATYGDVAVDRRKLEVTVAGQPVTLAGSNFTFVDILVRAQGNFMSDDAIVKKLFDSTRRAELTGDHGRLIEDYIGALCGELAALGIACPVESKGNFRRIRASVAPLSA